MLIQKISYIFYYFVMRNPLQARINFFIGMKFDQKMPNHLIVFNMQFKKSNKLLLFLLVVSQCYVSWQSQVPFQLFNQTVPYPLVRYYYSPGDNFAFRVKMSGQLYNQYSTDKIGKISVGRMAAPNDLKDIETIISSNDKYFSYQLEFYVQKAGYYICQIIPQHLQTNFEIKITAIYNLTLYLNKTRVDSDFKRLILLSQSGVIQKFVLLMLETQQFMNSCRIRVKWVSDKVHLYFDSNKNHQNKREFYRRTGLPSFVQITKDQQLKIVGSYFLIGIRIQENKLEPSELLQNIVVNITTFSQQKCQNNCSKQAFPVVGKQAEEVNECMCAGENLRWEPSAKKCLPFDFCGNGHKSQWEECDNGNRSGCINCHIQSGFMYNHFNKQPTIDSTVIIIISITVPLFLILLVLFIVFLLNKRVKKNSKQGTSKKIDAVLSNIPTQRNLLGKNENLCSICLQYSCTVCLPCNHQFHRECISEWLSKKGHCPLCNSMIK